MRKLEECTVLDILNMYKTIIGNDIEKVIATLFFDGEINNSFKHKIDSRIDKNNYSKKRIDFVYEEIIYILATESNSNNNESVKLTLLCEIYRRFSNKMTHKELKTLEDYILGNNLYVVYQYASENYRGIEESEIITREKQEKVKSIYDNKTRQLMSDLIRNTVEIYEICDVLKAEYGMGFYNTIIRNFYIKIFLDKRRMEIKEFKEKIANNELEEIVMEDEELNAELVEALFEFFCNNLQFIDKESLMMNSAARVILGLKLFKGEEIEGIELDENAEDATEKESIDFLRTIYLEMKKQNYNATYKISSEKGEEIICIDMEFLKEFLGRCTQSRYLTDNEIEQIHTEILEGQFPKDIEERKIAGVNLEDLINANNGYEKEEYNLKKEKKLKCNIELAEYLISEGIITEQELINMFLQGDFNIEFISGVNMKSITEKYYSDKFKELYYEMVFSKEPEKVKEIIQRFSSLCVQLVENNKINIDVDELIGDITTVLGDEFAPEILSDLYEFNIITLEKGIEWVGSDILLEEYKKGKLKPGEVRQLYESKKINLSGIANIINKLPDNGEKFMIIGSIFPEETEEDREIRELLFDECLKIDNGIKSNNSDNKRKNGQKEPSSYYKHITDPFARISLIKALDKDYSFEMTLDGHAIVKLPNFGKVIIEKMLDKNREPSYGAATYILDEKYYEDNSFRIKKDGKINRQEIIRDIDPKEVTRIIHSVKTWGTDIKEYFLGTKKIQWSKDEEALIDGAIQRVKRSDPVIKDNQQLAKMILNLVVTRKATIEQIEQIADIYGVNLGKIMNSLDER